MNRFNARRIIIIYVILLYYILYTIFALSVDYRSIFRPCALEKFNVHQSLSRNVGILRIFPSITSALVKAFLQPPIEGVVLQTYGAGNVPNNRADIFDALRDATDRGVIIVNITQCMRNGVTDIYESGRLLVDVGTYYSLFKKVYSVHR